MRKPEICFRNLNNYVVPFLQTRVPILACITCGINPYWGLTDLNERMLHNQSLPSWKYLKGNESFENKTDVNVLPSLVLPLTGQMNWLYLLSRFDCKSGDKTFTEAHCEGLVYITVICGNSLQDSLLPWGCCSCVAAPSLLFLHRLFPWSTPAFSVRL